MAEFSPGGEQQDDRAPANGQPAGELLAHVVQDAGGTWRMHALDDHLRDTGERAAEFADAFGAAEWARVAGRLHDLGKARHAFQAYLRRDSGFDPTAEGTGQRRVDHSTAGAMQACEVFGPLGRLIAYVVAGHHTGLPDWAPIDAGGDLAGRLRQPDLLAEALAAPLPGDLVRPPSPPSAPVVSNAESLHLWIRMLFSAVVDADSLDTEAFSRPNQAARRGTYADLEHLRSRLADHLRTLPHDRPLDRIRTELREACLAKAELPPGFFTLTIPTGGGKTLTSLAFALEHAIRNGQRRVIYAIPYVSIIEQTAKVFRNALGDDVLEHHASLDPDGQDERSELAAENWEAPIIVTTVVQLFESLLAARRGKARRVHNLARSVIILDEAQLLPPGQLDPILSILRTLVDRFGVSVLLTTATQPAIASRATFGRSFRGIDAATELVDGPSDLRLLFDRVEIRWPDDLDGTTSWPELAARIQAEPQVLCVVNRRQDCRELVALLPDDTIHLSAYMCAEHRSVEFDAIRAALRAGRPIRIVSTQLIEAGVDIDLPVVFRALSGLDSIAQAAGRCNREGRPTRGRLEVFVPPRRSPPGLLRKAEQATRTLRVTWSEPAGLMRPDAFRRYFELLYGSCDTHDENGVMPLLTEGAAHLEIQFRSAASRFRLVDDAGSEPILVPFGEGSALIDKLMDAWADRRPNMAGGEVRRLLRRLQRYVVNIRAHELRTLQASPGVEEIVPGIHALIDPTRYDPRLGLVVEPAPLDLVQLAV